MEKEKHAGGRPRIHNREQIAIDIIEWAKKTDSINLCKFCAFYDPPIPPSMLTRFKNESEEFRQAYETAKLFLGFRREEMLNAETLHVKAYDLNANTYDFFLKEEKQNQQKYESMLKAAEVKVADAADSAKLDALINIISYAQDSSKALRSSQIKSNADAKS